MSDSQSTEETWNGFTNAQIEAFKTNLSNGITSNYSVFVMCAVMFAIKNKEFQEQVGIFGIKQLEDIFTY